MSGEDYSKLIRLSEDFLSRLRVQKALFDSSNSVSRALEANGPILRLPHFSGFETKSHTWKTRNACLTATLRGPFKAKILIQKARTLKCRQSDHVGHSKECLCHEGAQNSKSGSYKHHTVKNHPKLRPGSLQYYHQRLPHHIEHSYYTPARIR